MNKNKGFTLIELLVVIAIIGILAGIILVSLNTARNRAKDAAVKADLAGIRNAMEIHYTNTLPNGTYGLHPLSSNNCPTVISTAVPPTSGFHSSAAMPYLDALRKNSPGTGNVVCRAAGQTYAIRAKLPSSPSGTGAQYWCVDNAGFSGLSTGIAGGTGVKATCTP